MKIEHICLNVHDIEKEKEFYCGFFEMIPNAKYSNPKTGWSNYFLSSAEGGARLELLSHAEMPIVAIDRKATCIVHLCLALGSREKVDKMTAKLEDAGYVILSHPRVTGDGYYESSFLDPEGNMIELTA
jgi:lactoylglutathione lyase